MTDSSDKLKLGIAAGLAGAAVAVAALSLSARLFNKSGEESKREEAEEEKGEDGFES